MGSLNVCGGLDIIRIRNQVRQTSLLRTINTPCIYVGALCVVRDERVAWRRLYKRRLCLGPSKGGKLFILGALHRRLEQ